MDIAIVDDKMYSATSSPFHSIGTIDMSVNLTEEAWLRLVYVFNNQGRPCDQSITAVLVAT
jgi:hypothetical protein